MQSTLGILLGIIKPPSERLPSSYAILDVSEQAVFLPHALFIAMPRYRKSLFHIHYIK